MRITLTLNEDVAAMIARLRKTHDSTINALLNEALREGLKHFDAPGRKQPHFRTRSVNLGRCLIGDLDDVTGVLAVVNGEPFR